MLALHIAYVILSAGIDVILIALDLGITEVFTI